MRPTVMPTWREKRIPYALQTLLLMVVLCCVSRYWYWQGEHTQKQTVANLQSCNERLTLLNIHLQTDRDRLKKQNKKWTDFSSKYRIYAEKREGKK